MRRILLSDRRYIQLDTVHIPSPFTLFPTLAVLRAPAVSHADGRPLLHRPVWSRAGTPVPHHGQGEGRHRVLRGEALPWIYISVSPSLAPNAQGTCPSAASPSTTSGRRCPTPNSHISPHPPPPPPGDAPVPVRLLPRPHPGRAARSLSAPKPSHAPRHSQGADGAHSAARCVCRGGEPGEEGDESGLHNVLPVQQYSFFAITSVSSHVPPAATQADPSRPPFYVTGSGGAAMLFLGTPRCANLDELQVWTDGWMRCIFTLAEIVAHPPAGSLCTTSLCATSLLRKEVPSPKAPSSPKALPAFIALA